jgi:hypothetical protein
VVVFLLGECDLVPGELRRAGEFRLETRKDHGLLLSTPDGKAIWKTTEEFGKHSRKTREGSFRPGWDRWNFIGI